MSESSQTAVPTASEHYTTISSERAYEIALIMIRYKYRRGFNLEREAFKSWIQSTAKELRESERDIQQFFIDVILPVVQGSVYELKSPGLDEPIPNDRNKDSQRIAMKMICHKATFALTDLERQIDQATEYAAGKFSRGELVAFTCKHLLYFWIRRLSRAEEVSLTITT
jgi:hypothetical protein